MALLEALLRESGTFQHSAQERSANEAKHGGERSVAESTERSDWKARALVAEARAELLEVDQDAWKTQAAKEGERLGDMGERLGEALRALAQAQDETRAARLIGGRGAGAMIEAQPTPVETPHAAYSGDSGGDGVPVGQVHGVLHTCAKWTPLLLKRRRMARSAGSGGVWWARFRGAGRDGAVHEQGG